MESAHGLRARIQEALADCIDPIVAIVRDSGVSPKIRIEAFNSLADRGGLPVFRAQIVQSISGNASLPELRDRRSKVEARKREISAELRELRSKVVVPPDGLPVPDEETEQL